MTDEASPEAAGEIAGGPRAPAHDLSPFVVRKVPPPTVQELQARRDAMERAIRFGAAPYRDAEGKARYVFFKDANSAPVEAWTRDRAAKRGYRRTQYARKAAGQMAWHPEDQIELGKRLGVIYHREGRSVEGAAERGLYDAIWRYEHVFDSFTVPRRFGRDSLSTGRIAAVAEEEARKLQAEDPKAIGGFWVRDRKNNGLIYVVPNPDPNAPAEDTLVDGASADSVAGMADPAESPAGPDSMPAAAALDDVGFYEIEDDAEDDGLVIVDPDEIAEGADGGLLHLAGVDERRQQRRRKLRQGALDEVFDGLIAVLDAGRDEDDPTWQQLARLVAEVAPGTGQVLSAREAYIAFKAAATAMEDGDWGQALLKGGEALFNAAGAVPAFGDLLRLGKGAVKVANLLFKIGHYTGARPAVAAIAISAGKVVTEPLVKQAKRLPARFKALPATPGGNEAARLLDLRSRVMRRHSGGFFEQTAERAFKGTRFPPRNAITNERRGLAATEMALAQVLRGEKGVVRDAMFRPGAGSITFYFGEAGNAAKKYMGGSGLAHIIAKHGPEVMPEVIETIAKGTHEIIERGLSKKMIIHYGDHKAVLVLAEARSGQKGSWLLTGYEKGDTDINFDLSQLTGPIFFKPH